MMCTTNQPIGNEERDGIWLEFGVVLVPEDELTLLFVVRLSKIRSCGCFTPCPEEYLLDERGCASGTSVLLPLSVRSARGIN